MFKRKNAEHPEIRDYGTEPFIFNIDHAASMNENFRTAIWTGEDIQLTLMSIPSGSDIGAEMHTDVEQFIRVVNGRAEVYFGSEKSDMQKMAYVSSGDAILIPKGTWHNIVNVGRRPLKLYSLYAPPKHPYGTVHTTREDEEDVGH